MASLFNDQSERLQFRGGLGSMRALIVKKERLDEVFGLVCVFGGCLPGSADVLASRIWG
jgi:hypothetical protein